MEDALRKTNRINLLFDFYQCLLTDKQQLYLKYYFHDDYSLGEISDLFGISRQAVNEHIKRAEHLLENYEEKLGLLAHHAYRQRQLHKLHAMTEELDEPQRQSMQQLLHEMAEADEPEAMRQAVKMMMKGGTNDGI